MNIYLYIIIFIIGTLFGSFYTLAVYRIPKKLDILYTHSFCPSCGHKLGFFELIPVFSYIFLGGKCKKCKQKIRPRYLILEILSGIAFVLIGFCLKIDVYNLELEKIIKFVFIALYLAAIFIIAGIDKEKKYIEKNVLYYSFFVSMIYIIYLCIMEQTSIYRYVMYLLILVILLIIDNIKLRNQAKDSYIISALMLIDVFLINSNELVTLFSVIVPILSIIINKIIHYIRNSLNKSKKDNQKEKYSFAFLMCLTNVIVLISQSFIETYIL